MKHVLLLAFLLITTSSIAQTVYANHVDGQLYVKIKNRYSIGNYTGKDVEVSIAPQFKNLATKYGITRIQRPFYIKSSVELCQIYRIDFSAVAKVDELIAELQKDISVEYAEKVPIARSFFSPNDIGPNDYSNGTWGLHNVNAQQAWDISTGSASVKIAIIDDAVQTNHEDLAPNMWVNPGEIANNGIDDDNNGYVDDVQGYDVGDNDNDPNPPDTSYEHGTHVAGIASAKSNNGIGIASIGSNCTIIPVKATNMAVGPEYISNGYDGILYAMSVGANIINMSWGGWDSSTTEHAIINAALAQGIVLVAAAGNSVVAPPYDSYPAAYNHVIAVASSGNNTGNDEFSYFSNYSPWVDILAPGSNILSSIPGNAYAKFSGTSMAAPLVSGTVGLMLSVNPNMTPDEVESCIEGSANYTMHYNIGYDYYMPCGRLDAYNAVRCAGGFTNFPPVASFYPYTTVCSDEPMQFYSNSTNNPTTYLWTFEGGTPGTSTIQNPLIFYNTVPGSIYFFNVKLKVTNPFGADSLNYDVPVKKAAEQPVIIQSGDTLICIPQDNGYTWYRNDTALLSPITQKFIPHINGVYKVSICGSPWCCKTSEPFIYPPVVSVTESDFDNSVSVFPNPAGNEAFVDIQLPLKEAIAIRLYNSTGQAIAQINKATGNAGRYALPIANLSSGLYFVEIYTTSQHTVKKLFLTGNN